VEDWKKSRISIESILLAIGLLISIAGMYIYMDRFDIQACRTMLIVLFIIVLVHLIAVLHFEFVTRDGYARSIPAALSEVSVGERFPSFISVNGHLVERRDDREFRLILLGKPYSFNIEGTRVIFFLESSSMHGGIIVSKRNETIISLVDSFLAIEEDLERH